MSAIEWTDVTWNPTVGCSRVSPGCDGCYAIGVAHRAMQPAHEGLTIRRPGERPDWTGEVRCLPDRLDVPLRWRKPRRVFVDSMSDLFHPDVPDLFVAEVWGVMENAPRHTYQILTKRPQRMATLLNDPDFWEQVTGRPEIDPIPCIWLGTSIESDRYAFRADYLRATPAAVRFLSLEPLLGPLPSVDLTGIDWVIVGGESGPGARPMQPDWVRDIRDRCVDVGVPFFFKQWGAMVPYEPDPQPPFWVSQHGDLIDGHHLPAELSEGDRVDEWWAPDLEHDAIFRWVGKKAAGRELDGRTWDEMPS
jgi:protein gp37